MAAVVTASLLAGCSGSDGEPVAAPGPSPAGTTSDPTQPPESPEPTQPSAAPATGPELALPAVSLRAPDGWRRTRLQAEFQLSATAPGLDDGALYLSQLPSLNPDRTRAQLERSTAETSGLDDPRVQEPVTVDGVEMVHVSGRDRYSVDEVFVALLDGELVTVRVEVDADASAPERQETVASVLASVSWR